MAGEALMTMSEKMVERGCYAACVHEHGSNLSEGSSLLTGNAKKAWEPFVRAILTAALSDQVVVNEPYLVWSNQHRAWWRPNSHGYTNDVRSAGLYERDEAISISGQGRDGWLEPKKAPDELAIPLSALPKNIRAMIAAAPLPEVSGE